jgi:hypothetical protein
MYLIGCTYNLCWTHDQLGQTPAVAAGLTDHVWSLQHVLTYKVTPQLLASMHEAQRQDMIPSSNKEDKPKGVRGRASKYYLILLKMKQEKEMRASHAP